MVQPANRRFVTEGALDDPDSPARASLNSTYPTREDAAVTFGLRGLIPITGDTFTTGEGLSPQTTTGTGSSPFTVVADATGIRLAYGNWRTYLNGSTYFDADGPANVTIRASVEYSGAVYPVRFGGKATYTIEPGGLVISDPLAINVSKGTLLVTRTYIDGSAGTWYPTRMAYQGAGFGGWVANLDYTSGSFTIPDSIGARFSPMAILGVAAGAPDPAFIVGDSIANGTGDSQAFQGRSRTSPAAHGGGYINRALNGEVGAVNSSYPGDRAFNVRPNLGHYRRFSLMPYCRVMICQHGRNDLVSGQTLAATQDSLLGLWRIGRLADLRVYQTTITPTTTSTDGWVTTANQTVTSPTGYNLLRTQLNDWIRSGAPISPTTGLAVGSVDGALLAGDVGHPLSGYWEVADIAETARNSGVWKAGYTSDGAHPNPTGAAALSAAVNLADLGVTV